MTIDQRTLSGLFTVDADFQAWCQGIHAQIAAMGLVQTSDTGQINPTTVLRTASTNTSQGYEVWRFTDTLQSTLPIFLKLEYGSGGNVGSASLWFTVGTGSNGAGTLTGQVGTRRQAGAAQTGGNLPSYCSSDGSGIFLLAGYQPTTGATNVTFLIERTRDGSGNPTADGIITWSSTNNPTPSNADYIQVIPSVGTIPPGGTSTTTLWMFSPINNASPGGLAVVGKSVSIVPAMFLCGKLFFSKLMHLMVASTTSIGIPIAANTFGSVHTYLTFNPSGLNPPSNNTSDCLCVLWE